MGRKSYFDLIAEMGFDAEREYDNLNDLLRRRTSGYDPYSILRGFSERFLDYPNRMGFIDFDDLTTFLEEEFEGEELLFLFTELIIDYLSYIERDGGFFDFNMPAYQVSELAYIEKVIRENVKRFLDLSNHELIELEDGRQIIVEKNAYASEVSQIISANNIQEAIKVLEYNHFSNKGNLSRKREILKSLADYLEPLRKELNADAKLPEVLRSQNKKIIAIEKLFEMYNNLDVRHNNDKQYSKEFSEQEMEQWYDDLYTSTLFVILSLEESRIISNLDELKQSQLN